VQARKAKTMMEQTLMEQCGQQPLPGVWGQLALAQIAFGQLALA
jgi:hypothetical protein